MYLEIDNEAHLLISSHTGKDDIFLVSWSFLTGTIWCHLFYNLPSNPKDLSMHCSLPYNKILDLPNLEVLTDRKLNVVQM